ncbi:MAG: magnesium/cobalt transporter CorA [Anaerolineales bacterium]|nr:magnesium/cobalt transporter CorA [Anaerolineales bacterium]
MIRSLYWAPDGALHVDLAPDAYAQALRTSDGLLWVDISAEPDATVEPILHEVFGFHPLAIDDALQEAHVPKVDDWTDYVYLVLHAVVFSDASEAMLDTLELDLFVGRNYVVTYQARPLAAVERVWASVQRAEQLRPRGPGRLLYRLADEVVADYMPTVETIDDAIDRIEDQVFDDPAPVLLERIFTVKRALLQLRRIIAPQREVLNKLGRGDFAVILAEDRVFFRDVYDHLVRLFDIAESLRDLVSSALDTYLSVVNNRMNGVMKTLTVITTLFMPITFLTGFFGMNFLQPTAPLQEWTSRPAFLFVLLLVALVPAGMYLWMRRRAWM